MKTTAMDGRHGLVRTAQQIWQAPGTHPAVLLLQPLSALFGALVRTRRATYARGWQQAARAPVPVISIGNLTVGGAGKTPLTRWLVSELLARRQRPAILHGGYAGDEPELHRNWHPEALVYAGRDRVALSRAAARDGASVIVLDDGRQHLKLGRDLDIVLVLSDSWSRPQRLLPSGAWREPLSTLVSADAVIVTRKAASANQAANLASELGSRFPRPVVAVANLALAGWKHLHSGEPAIPPAQAVVACGIAEPEGLVAQLETSGTRVVDTIVFADHQQYGSTDLQRIRERGRAHPVVITEKDAIKISKLDPAFPALVVEQCVHVEQGLNELQALLDRILQ